MSAKQPTTERDSIGHWLLRGVQHVCRWLLIGSAILTGIFLVFLGPLVVAPALVMIFSYLAVLIVNYFERKARPATDASMEPLLDRPDRDSESSADPPDDEPNARTAAHTSGSSQPAGDNPVNGGMLRPKRKRALKVTVWIVASLAVLASLIAAMLLNWRPIAIGALVVFAWLLFSGAPFWIAAVSDQSDQAEAAYSAERAPDVVP